MSTATPATPATPADTPDTHDPLNCVKCDSYTCWHQAIGDWGNDDEVFYRAFGVLRTGMTGPEYFLMADLPTNGPVREEDLRRFYYDVVRGHEAANVAAIDSTENPMVLAYSTNPYDCTEGDDKMDAVIFACDLATYEAYVDGLLRSYVGGRVKPKVNTYGRSVGYVCHRSIEKDKSLLALYEDIVFFETHGLRNVVEIVE
jgi:hypothetical protein